MAHLTNQLLAYNLTGAGIQPGDNPVSTLENILSSVIGVLTLVAVIFFTIQIILAGFSFISSQGDAKELESSKKKLTSSVIGLAVVVLAYGIGALISHLLGLNSVFDLSTVLKPF